MAELTNQVVSRQEWSDARNRLLIKEKEYTRLGDQLSEERRRLPWERVEKEYIFDGPAGKRLSLSCSRAIVNWRFIISCSDRTGMQVAPIAHFGPITSMVLTFI